MSNTGVSFLKVSLKIHTDVLAGKRVNQTWKLIVIKFLMVKNLSPPCNSHLVHWSMSDFVPEDVTFAFVENNSSF